MFPAHQFNFSKIEISKWIPVLVLLTHCSSACAQTSPDFPKMDDHLFDAYRYEKFLQLEPDDDKRKPKVHDKSDTKYDAPDDGGASRNSTPNVGEKFDGSQYGASTFIDTDFGRHSYRDDFTTPVYSGAAMYKNRVDTARDDLKKDRLDPDDDRRARLWRNLTTPPPGMLHDWVPSPPDPGSNGGFGLGADNGAPVPYNLNGFPDLERGLPWKPAN